jgi:hypothetical protein
MDSEATAESARACMPVHTHEQQSLTCWSRNEAYYAHTMHSNIVTLQHYEQHVADMLCFCAGQYMCIGAEHMSSLSLPNLCCLQYDTQDDQDAAGCSGLVWV